MQLGLGLQTEKADEVQAAAPPPAFSYLLREDGSFLLREDGSKIKREDRHG